MAKAFNTSATVDLPQFREITDPKALADKLQAFMRPHIRIDSCKIDRIRFRPGGSCRFLIKAKVCYNGQKSCKDQIFFGWLFDSRKHQERFLSLLSENLTPLEHFPPAIIIPEWRFIVLAYPNDPALPGLPFLSNNERVLDYAKKSPETVGLPTKPVEARSEMIKYIPFKRGCFLMHFDTNLPGSNKSTSVFNVFAKAYGAGKVKKVFTIMQNVWESDARKNGNLILPHPFSYDSENGVIWQEALSGQPLSKVASDIDNLPELAKEIGFRLAALHGSSIDMPVKMNLDFQLNKITEYAAAIAKTQPQFSENCDNLVNRLLDYAQKLNSNRLTPVHASFKFSHIFLTNKGVAFIDFDGANMGDPGEDLGRFVAYVRQMVIDKKFDERVAEETITNFCEAYNQAAITPVNQAHIDWFTASHLLVSHIYKSVKRLNIKRIERQLQIANQLCPV